MEKNICIRLEADAKQIMNCREAIHSLDHAFGSFSEVLNLAGNPVRLKILYLLNKEKRLCVCDLSDILEMNVSAVSQHLRKLKDRNLIKRQREAQTIFYSLNKKYEKLLNPFLSILNNNKIPETL